MQHQIDGVRQRKRCLIKSIRISHFPGKWQEKKNEKKVCIEREKEQWNRNRVHLTQHREFIECISVLCFASFLAFINVSRLLYVQNVHGKHREGLFACMCKEKKSKIKTHTKERRTRMKVEGGKKFLCAKMSENFMLFLRKIEKYSPLLSLYAFPPSSSPDDRKPTEKCKNTLDGGGISNTSNRLQQKSVERRKKSFFFAWKN